jgi:hypothetical protein
MRGRRYRGSINDGDWVEIAEKWKPGQQVEPRRVRNLTTGSLVEASSGHVFLKSLIGLLVFLVLAGVMFAVFIQATGG